MTLTPILGFMCKRCGGTGVEPILSVVKLPVGGITDVPARLRELADDIEGKNDAKGYGDVHTCAVVIFGDRLHVFGYGTDAAAPTVGLVLQAGLQKLASSLVEHGT